MSAPPELVYCGAAPRWFLAEPGQWPEALEALPDAVLLAALDGERRPWAPGPELSAAELRERLAEQCRRQDAGAPEERWLRLTEAALELGIGRDELRHEIEAGRAWYPTRIERNTGEWAIAFKPLPRRYPLVPFALLADPRLNPRP